MRPSLRSDSLMSVNFDWWGPVAGMQGGWIWVKQGFASAAPRLWARQIAGTFEPLALVERGGGGRGGGAGGNVGRRGVVRAERQLWAGRARRVEGGRHLHPAKGGVREQAAVPAGERHARGGALVDDARADSREPIHVRL